MAQAPLIDIVKRGGKRPSETFDRSKLHRSVHAACLSVNSPDGLSQDIADKVCDVVIVWCEKRPEVTSDDIRRQAATALETFHPEAAYIYRHHRLIM